VVAGFAWRHSYWQPYQTFVGVAFAMLFPLSTLDTAASHHGSFSRFVRVFRDVILVAVDGSAPLPLVHFRGVVECKILLTFLAADLHAIRTMAWFRALLGVHTVRSGIAAPISTNNTTRCCFSSSSASGRPSLNRTPSVLLAYPISSGGGRLAHHEQPTSRFLLLRH